MTLSDVDIREFSEIWKKEFGEQLSPDAARTELLRLLDFFATLAVELGAKAAPQTAPAVQRPSPS